MLRGVLFAVVFIIAALVAIALVAPLVVPRGRLDGVGEAAAPIALLVFGPLGFVVGMRRRK